MKKKREWKNGTAWRIGILLIVMTGILCGCSCPKNTNWKETTNENEKYIPEKIGEMQLDYANQFAVTYYEQGYSYIEIADGRDYVLIPEGAKRTNLGHEGATLIDLPCQKVYQAATSGADLIRELGALDEVVACSTTSKDYKIPEVSQAIEKNKIQYVGKYSAPDYEKLLELDTGLAIESTMIYHAPKILEQLERLEIPVLVERSSYEKEPLGRLEWIKLYGLLLGKKEEAEAFFDTQVKKVNESIKSVERREHVPKIAFFYLASNGYVNVRKPQDYISKMIQMAGGAYAFDSLHMEEENALSTINLSWEDFYAYGKEADILIYNSTIDGGMNNLDELLQMNSLFREFKAIREGSVYCTKSNMFQESSKIGEILMDLATLINDKGDHEKMDFHYLYPLSME